MQLHGGVVRFHPALGCWQRTDRGEWALLGRYPAMVARVSGADGSPVTLHRTYLIPDGRKAPVAEPKELMAYPGNRLAGGALRLFAPALVPDMHTHISAQERTHALLSHGLLEVLSNIEMEPLRFHALATAGNGKTLVVRHFFAQFI